MISSCAIFIVANSLSKGSDLLISVTLCDDNPVELKHVDTLVRKYFSEASAPVEVTQFTSSVELHHRLQDNITSDLYILDISMPGLNGFQIAEEIRKHSSCAVIIFLTSHTEYASVGYRYKALRYVSKLMLEAELPEAIRCAIAEIGSLDSAYLTLSHYNDIWKIPYSEIVYVNKVLRRLEITTKSHGVIPDSRGINELFDVLHDKRFLFLHRSCFVNIDYISSINNLDVKTSTGDILPISRRSYQKVFAAIAERWGHSN